MLTHIVLMKFKDPAQVEPTRAMLQALPAQIEQIKHYELGVNVIHSERAYDLALYSKFDSIPALQAYQAHPAHQAVLAHIQAVITSSVVVDYEA